MTSMFNNGCGWVLTIPFRRMSKSLFQPQYAKNWGAAALQGTGRTANSGGNPGQCGASICANDPFNVATGESFFVRQAYVLIRKHGSGKF